MAAFLTAADAEKKYREQWFSVELLEELTGRIAVRCHRDCGRISGKWQLEIDGVRHSFGQFLITSMNAGEVREFLLSVEVPDLFYGSEAVLIVRFFDENMTEVAAGCFAIEPPARILPEKSCGQFFTGVRFDVSRAIISSGKLSAVIDADGMRELRFNGEKLLNCGARLFLWRAGLTPAELKHLKLDRIKISPDRFVSDGSAVECHALALPVAMEVDELEFTQRFTPVDDGTLRYDAEFVVPESFAGIPRLGVVLRLPQTMSKVEYFGDGEHENYPGNCGGIKSRYRADVADMFTKEHPLCSGGGRSNVSWVTLRDDSGKVLRITGGNRFTFAALPFSEFAIDDAAAAGRFPRAESEISLYIDCRIGDAHPIKAGVYRMTLFFSSPVTTAD